MGNCYSTSTFNLANDKNNVPLKVIFQNDSLVLE